jgi:uncharacterized membrane protein YfcA
MAALAALAAGFVNALAGGGTLITFPVLVLLGLPPVSANVTNNVALLPGYLAASLSQRRDLGGWKAGPAVLLPVSLAGGLAGALALLATGEALFVRLVPWLLYLGVALIAAQPLLKRMTSPPAGDQGRVRPVGSGFAAALAVGCASAYGGYFGAGVSVILLAILGLAYDGALRELNALKQALSFTASLAAAIIFAAGGGVRWDLAALMALASMAGGALGGKVARRARPGILRAGIVALGFAAATWFLLKSPA